MVVGAATAAIGALIAGAFSWRLARHQKDGRGGHAVAWTLALGLYAVGMVALAVGLAVGWHAVTFGVYWVAGALLNVALLAVGQLLLLDPARGPLWWLLGAVVAALTVAAVAVSSPDAGVLATATARDAIPDGEAAFGGQALAWTILRPVTLTSFAIVLGGSLWSGLRRRRLGVLLVAAGVTVAATSSVLQRAGMDAAVPAALTAGVAVMYAGFRAAGRTRRAGAPAAGATAAPPGGAAGGAGGDAGGGARDAPGGEARDAPGGPPAAGPAGGGSRARRHS